MRKLSLLVILLLFVTVPVRAESSISLTYQLLDAEVKPGGETNMFITITNPSSMQGVSNVKLYLTPSSHISVSPSYIELGGLAQSASQQTSFIVKAKPSAVSGTEYITVKAKYVTDSTTKESNINVPVKIARDPALQILKVDYSKIPKPGTETVLTLSIVNNGIGDARDVTLRLNNTDLFVPDKYEAFIKQIKTGSNATVQFRLSINPSAKIGTHSIALVLNYYNEIKDKKISETKNIPLKIEGDIDFIVTPEEYSAVEGKNGNVVIKIANAGTEEAQFVTLTAEGQTIYIGNLKSDDYDTESINIKPSRSGPYPINLQLSYKDIFGREYAKNFTIEVNVAVSEKSPDYTAAYILIAAVLIVAVVFYKKRR